MRQKFTLFLLITTLLLMVSILAISASADDPVFIYAFLDGETIEITTNDSIDLGWGWYATTKGLVNVFIKNSEYSFQLTDSAGGVELDLDADASRAFFGQTYSIVPEDYLYTCPVPYLWGAEWHYYLEPLEAGMYTLEAAIVFDTPVNDGLHVCFDDFLGEEIPPPNLFTSDDNMYSTLTIKVLEP